MKTSSLNIQKNTFCGFNKNLAIAQRTLYEFKKEFPYLASSSHIELAQFYQKDSAIIADLEKIRVPIRRKINVVYNTMAHLMPFYSFKEYMNWYKEEVKQLKVANCFDHMELAYCMLKDKGLKPIKMCIYIVDKKFIPDGNKPIQQGIKRFDNYNHSFVLLDKNLSVKSKEPQRLGKDAIIFDSWCNMAIKASTGVEVYKKLFKFNPKKEKLVFFPFFHENYRKVEKFDPKNPLNIIL